VDGFVFCKWWRRRELNPRPKTFRAGVYILRPAVEFRKIETPPGKGLIPLACKNFALTVTGLRKGLSCKSTLYPNPQEENR
jgi:hypothetical protein